MRLLAITVGVVLLLALSSVTTAEVPWPRLAEGEAVIVNVSLFHDYKCDPSRAGDLASATICSLLYEPLYRYAPFDQQYQLVPWIAAELPTVSDDGLEWRIPIGPEVKFQDSPVFPEGKGRRLTPEDVVFSLKRIAADNATSGYWALEMLGVEGMDEFRILAMDVEADDQTVRSAMWAYNRSVTGLRTDGDCVVIRLKRPAADLPYILAMPYFYVVPYEAGDNLEKNPVGSGPFLLEERERSRRTVMLRDDEWWGTRVHRMPKITKNTLGVAGTALEPMASKLSKARLPLADEIVLWHSGGMEDAAGFKAGSLDSIVMSAQDLAEWTDKDGQLLQVFRDKGIVLEKHRRQWLEYISINMDHPVTGKAGGEKARAVRRAFALSIDRTEIIRATRQGLGSIPTSIVPDSNMPGCDPGYKWPIAVHDSAKGRQLLEQAGFSVSHVDGDLWRIIDPVDGRQPTIEVMLRGTSEPSKAMSKALSDAGKSVGIHVECKLMPFPDFLDASYGGKGQAYNGGWILDYPSADNILGLLISSEAKEDGLNSARYRDERFDAALAKFRAIQMWKEFDQTEAQKLFREMHELLAEDCPFIPLYVGSVAVLRHSWASNMYSGDFGYDQLLYAWVNISERDRLSSQWKDKAEEGGSE